MSQSIRLTPFIALTLGGLLACGTALAQTSPAPAMPHRPPAAMPGGPMHGGTAPTGAPGAPAVPAAPAMPAAAASGQPQKPGAEQQAAQGDQQQQQQGRQDADTSEETAPVLAVTSVEMLRSSHSSGIDIVLVHGVTTSDGWSGGTLVPLTRGDAADGVLDLVLVAHTPQDASGPSSYAPIQAILPLDSGYPYKAIRVRGATNSVTLKELPGYAETKLKPEVCGPCVGKRLVMKGSAPPSGVAGDQVVREEDLPANTRIIRPTDGVGDMDRDANRLTLLLGDDGTIVDAAWE